MAANEVGTIRRTPDGGFEYLRRQGATLRRGYFEEWERASTHAAREMPLPPRFVQALHRAGFNAHPPTLYELLIADGWTPPGSSSVLEQVDPYRPVREGLQGFRATRELPEADDA